MSYKDKIEAVVEEGMNKLAIKMVKKSVHSTCAWSIHQPKMPEEAKQLKK